MDREFWLVDTQISKYEPLGSIDPSCTIRKLPSKPDFKDDSFPQFSSLDVRRGIWEHEFAIVNGR